MKHKSGFYSFIDGNWTFLSQYVSSAQVKSAYKANYTIYWGSHHSMGTKMIWREMIVPGRWRPLKGEPKPLQMLRLCGVV